MSKFVGIFDYVNRNDLTVLHLERRCLQCATLIGTDVAGQTIDYHGANQRWRWRILATHRGENTKCKLRASYDIPEGEHLATAIGMDLDVLRQDFRKSGRVSIPRGGEEGACKPVRFGCLDNESRPSRLNMFAGS